MEQKVTEIISHMSHSHTQMARVIQAERQVAVRMSQLLHAIPDDLPSFDGTEGVMENASLVNKSVVSYLNAIADLEEAMAENLGYVIKELRDSNEE
jgi:hypothetical protein